MKKIIFPIVFLSGVLFITSCKKDDAPAASNSNSNTPSAKTTLLMANSWTYTASTADKSVDVDGDGTSSTNVYAQESICQTDVDYTFKANKVGTVSGDCGGTVAPGGWNFSWVFDASESTIITTVAGQVTNMTILQLDATTLKVSYPDTDDNNLAFTNTTTFTKKP
ncbi:hypothetical protein [Cytophaga aurantiaca]|uniref:hypothetical protein n=1 Tax=Cytophaga aurantiaca TaxID=29530 RepID=UPI00037B646C|nr:hypothetical protein [Cytophaga aurantiaca]